MKKIEKELQNQLNKANTSNFSSIMEKCKENTQTEEPILQAELATVSANGVAEVKKSSFNKGYFITITSILLALVVSVLLITILVTNGNKQDELLPGYFVIDINPSIEVVYDKDGNVTSVKPLNEDAEIVLCDLDFSGKSCNEAVEIIFENCLQLGYISLEREDNTVLTTAINDKGVKDDSFTKKIQSLFEKEFSKREMQGIVITGVDNEELRKEAEKYGIDAQKYSLIKEYIELGGNITEEEYKKISIRELYSSIYEKEKENKANEVERLKEASKNALIILVPGISAFVSDVIDEVTIISELATEKEKEKYVSLVESLDKLLDDLTKVESADELSEVLKSFNELFDDIEEGSIQLGILLSSLETTLRPLINSFTEIHDKFGEMNKTPHEKKQEILSGAKPPMVENPSHNQEHIQGKDNQKDNGRS